MEKLTFEDFRQIFKEEEDDKNSDFNIKQQLAKERLEAAKLSNDLRRENLRQRQQKATPTAETPAPTSSNALYIFSIFLMLLGLLSTFALVAFIFAAAY